MPELSRHHERIRRAVLDALPAVPPVGSQDLSAVHTQLVSGLLPIPADAGLADGVQVKVDRYSLPAAQRCPSSAAPTPFAWTTMTTSRWIGIRALHRVLLTGEGVAGAVVSAIADEPAEGRGPGAWLAAQDTPARAATVATAGSWAARALLAVPWRHLGAPPRFHFKNTWYGPLGYGSPIVLIGRHDAVIRPNARDGVLLRLGPLDPAVSRLDALVYALDRDRAPLRIVTVHPSSGNIDSIDVTPETLRQAATDVIAAARALAPMVAGTPGTETPCQTCWWCDHRQDCRPGQAWMANQPRRVAGIPLTS